MLKAAVIANRYSDLHRGHKGVRQLTPLAARNRKVRATVKMIPPICVKPYVKRQKNDANVAEATTAPASRPTDAFCRRKSAEKQASGMALRTGDLLVTQKTQTTNAMRGHLAEYGLIAPGGTVHLNR